MGPQEKIFPVFLPPEEGGTSRLRNVVEFNTER
jgi:hypothetical protein